MKNKGLPSRNEVRAFYESSNLSHKKIAEHYINEGFSISHKTVEKWSADDKWIKNNYSSYELALEASESLKSEDGNILLVLHRESLIKELALNLASTKKIADKSNSATTKKIYQEMLLKIFDRTQDTKDCGISLNTMSVVYSESELNKMSQKELMLLADSMQ